MLSDLQIVELAIRRVVSKADPTLYSILREIADEIHTMEVERLNDTNGKGQP